MRTRLFIFQLLLFVFTINLNANTISPKAIKGVIDLRDISNTDKFSFELNGEWEFYWGKMLRPHDFTSGKIKPDYYGKVPSYWTDYPQESIKTEKFGFATYRLTVLLPAGINKPLGIDLPVFDSSYDIYVDGKYLGGNGMPGKSAIETEPGYKKNFYSLNPESDSLTIIINVSNFFHRRGGFWLPLKLGTYHEIQQSVVSKCARDWAVIGMLMGFSIFFFFFFIISKREKIMEFFSLVLAGLAIRPLFTSNFLINDLMDISWIWVVRMEYIGLFMVIIGASWFIMTLYPTKIFGIFTWICTIIYSLVLILTLFLPVKIFSYAMLFYYPTVLVLVSYILFKSFLEILKKNLLDTIYFFTFLLLILGGFHDMRVSLGKADSSVGYLLTYIIVLLVFIQAGVLLYKWVRAFQDNERLQGELKFMNKNLEELITSRTQELQTRNNKIEQQNKKISSQNEQLSETIQLKNKIFSLIAHDLRSPVVNILYMLNLIKEEEYKEKYNTFVNTSIEYAQLVINLLENMLVWGRGLESKITYSPEKRDLADVILTNLSIFKETADKKEISVNFTQVGNSIAYFDKDLLDIIIRNLLSNAVKYTPRGGRISILLKDKTLTKEGIILKICDNGIGISEIQQKVIFTSAEIESTPGTEDEKGTGLGLKLCSELVKIHNGKITIESREGEGSCFIVLLNLENNGREV